MLHKASAEEENGEEGGGGAATIGCLEVPRSRRNFTLMRLFIGRLHGVTCRGNRNDVLLIPAVIADHLADGTPAVESPGPKLHVLCIHLN